tara:strand:- start:448 stop:1554 length:1107 start_codon:yes stop_codon:yes gene_type:complete
MRSYRKINKRISRQINVGSVLVGGGAPISVQSMTNTITTDIKSTINQIIKLEKAGADIIRVSCPDEASAKALKFIVKETNAPIVADIHYHYLRGIEAAESGASCLRINPGNIGSSYRIKELVKVAIERGISIRIGVNAGSLEKEILEKYGEPCPDAMVESALNHAKFLEDLGFLDFKISVKASDIFLAVESYKKLANLTDAPLHLGVTEAGGFTPGTVKSSIGIGSLLWNGIGDTIRVSLSADPVEEIRVGFEILKSMGIRNRGVSIISCPSCARQGFPVIKTVEKLEERLAHITVPLTLSIIGCVVNGPGEAKETDIGLTGGKNSHMIYLNGVADHKISDEAIFDHIVELVESKAFEIKKAGKINVI